MFREVLCRLARIVIVRRTMVVVMVAGTVHVIDLMGDVEHFSECRHAALHSETMQGKHQHQQNAEKTTHGNVIDSNGGDYTNMRHRIGFHQELFSRAMSRAT